jgi:hypothetical protein
MHARRAAFALPLAAIAAVAAPGIASAASKSTVYTLKGHVITEAPVGANTLFIKVEDGDYPGLKAMLGDDGNATVLVNGSTSIQHWMKRTPSPITLDQISAGDWVTVQIRAHRGLKIADLQNVAAKSVADYATHWTPKLPLFRYSGTVISTTPASVTVTVDHGNKRALHSLLNQPSQETFAVGAGTQYLLWTGWVPTVETLGDLVPGDTVAVNVRAPGKSTLAQLLATPARTIGEHQPAAPDDQTKAAQ